MKKRAMKKWIPKDTVYCYKFISKTDNIEMCKWWANNPNKPEQCSGYCKYLKQGDWECEGLSLLWDKCKECNVSEYTK